MESGALGQWAGERAKHHQRDGEPSVEVVIEACVQSMHAHSLGLLIKILLCRIELVDRFKRGEILFQFCLNLNHYKLRIEIKLTVNILGHNYVVVP